MRNAADLLRLLAVSLLLLLLLLHQHPHHLLLAHVAARLSST